MAHAILTLDTTISAAFSSTCSNLEGCTRFIKTPKMFLQRVQRHSPGSLLTPVECQCMGKGVSLEKNDYAEAERKRPRRSAYKASRGLITVRKSDGNWADSWTSEYVTSLKALGLKNLVTEDDRSNDDVVVALSVQKHAAVGFSVDGRVISSVIRQCACCCTRFCNQIDASFDAWCIPTNNSSSHFQKAAEVNDDPSIVFFPAGREEASLDDVVRDTIRLSYSMEAICSDACRKSGVKKWEFGDAKGTSVDKRWLPILKAKTN
eukprot:Gb_07148 [translate_table: standard]